MYFSLKAIRRICFLFLLALLLISWTFQQEKPFTFVVIGDHRPANSTLQPPPVFTEEIKSIEKLEYF